LRAYTTPIFFLVLILGFILGGCGECNDDTGDDDARDSGGPADAGQPDAKTDGRPDHDAYLEYARKYCEGPPQEGASERVLVGESGVSDQYGGMFFTDEPGLLFFYITESCELYTPQLCKIGWEWETEECVTFLAGQLPFTRTKLNSEKLATLLETMRVLEWSTFFESGDQFSLNFHETGVLVWFGDLHFYVAQTYIETNWEDPREIIRQDALSPFMGMFHISQVDFTSPMHEMLRNAEEVTYDKVRVVLKEVPADSDFVKRQRRIYPWPMSLSPDDLHVLQLDEDYHFGTSNAVFGADAEGMRQLAREVVTIALDLPVYERDRAITVQFEDRMFIIQMRETLPFEGENGLIHGVYDWWQDPPYFNVPY